ncbi:hypothetical protein [Calothrix sp. PCC 6303]|uniref:hypothetical protein n=1 Tax=Calothrix sp. PCC 6303 TaxID=1170562 RepID=UPI0002A0366D|nr:hypothetical protein [Calothrix sp. PCC 6303]AFZ03984.1 hypothetical protein Cal6303_5095 [Calothrix sp. PCC 6303]
MCDFTKGFILCSCKKEKEIVHNKNSRRYKKAQADTPQVYRWYLSEFQETYESLKEGECSLPTSDIGQGLNEEWVLLNLNQGSCFDFKYTPKEGDNLVMNSSNSKSFYLSFIFQNREWKTGFYSTFSTILKLKIDGEIQQIKEDE